MSTWKRGTKYNPKHSTTDRARARKEIELANRDFTNAHYRLWQLVSSAHDDGLLTMADLVRITGRGRSTIFRMKSMQQQLEL